MKLTNPTDGELDVAFAIEIAGWKWALSGGRFLVDPADGLIHNPPKFTTSADAVLPWLEKACIWDASYLGASLYRITHWSSAGGHKAEASTFARAAVIVLLRVKGIEITP